MRVLIVATNQEHRPDPVVPLGAAFAAAAARAAGHETRLYDACFSGARWRDELARELAAFAPEVVGLSLRNVDDVAWPRARSFVAHDREFAACVRLHAPRAALVLGGAAFSLFPHEYLQAFAADYGIAGEGEAAFMQLLSAIAQGRAQRGLHPARTGAHPPLEPALDLLDLDQYYRRGGALSVQSRRGCTFSCAYCTYPVLEGRQARVRDVRRVVDELERLHDERGFAHFFVVDNTFNVPQAHALAFCAELERRSLALNWSAYVTPAGLTREVVAAMAGAGCTSVDLGTDAATPQTLAGLRKSFGPEEIEVACGWLREARVRFSHSLILGGPGETRETLEQTVRFINATRPTMVNAMLGVRVYPGTELARLAESSHAGLEPVFYISEHVRDELVAMARAVRHAHPHWYFPGLEGNRWQRLWSRQRHHGAKGPLWALHESVHIPGEPT